MKFPFFFFFSDLHRYTSGLGVSATSGMLFIDLDLLASHGRKGKVPQMISVRGLALTIQVTQFSFHVFNSKLKTLTWNKIILPFE